jgi:two-component system, OmpR family, response regulator
VNVLVVEDAPYHRDFVVEGLRLQGHSVSCASDMASARELLARDKFDIVVVDRMLPDGDGVDLVRELRRAGNEMPTIALSGRDRVEERVEGLRSGLDDYLVKPYSFEELIARIDALARRSGSMRDIAVGPLRIDIGRHQVERDGNVLDLTAREFSLLVVLARNVGQVMSRQRLLDQVWGIQHDTRTNVVDVYIRYLREKIGPGLIHTVRGVGYSLDPERDAD